MRKTKESLKSRSLPLLEHYKTAKDYEESSVRTLEIVKDASDRAHNTELASRMARETGLIDFSVDHPFHGLYRVPSTTSDWSDCTLPDAPGGDGPRTPGTDGGDPPTQQFLNLPSVSGDHLSSIVGDEDSPSRPGSPGQTLIEPCDIWSNTS